jgi:hypothetical protein
VKERQRTWLAFRWPREVTPEQVEQLCRLLVSSAGTPIVIEISGSGGRVQHHLALDAGHSDSLVDQLRSALPGVAIERLKQRPEPKVNRAVALHLSSRERPLTQDLAGVSRALLTALAHAHTHEQLHLQWVLASRVAARPVPTHLIAGGSWWQAFLLAPLSPPREADSELRTAMVRKQAEPGWRAIGRIGVQAGSRQRQRQLIGQVLAALRLSQAPGVQWWASPVRPSQLIRAVDGWWRPLRLNALELAVIGGWPVGETDELPVEHLAARLLAPPSSIPRRGRVVGQATYPGKERPLALTPADSLRHVHVLGPHRRR